MELGYRTEWGEYWHGKAEDYLASDEAKALHHSVDLIFTSPPFPLNRKKKYGNLQGQEYLDWIAGFAESFRQLLKPNGSIVIELGNAWERGHPVMSTLALEALLALRNAGDFYLCQQFVWYNPAKLPTPAEWVNVRRIRVKDAFTHLWWLSATDQPKADNRRVLKAYSASMKELLRTGKYNAGRRPSEHVIGKESFKKDNNGAIPSNVITVANTRPNKVYSEYCKAHNLRQHPAIMPIELPEFFIKFLTDPGDLVLDPFAGSNTTGSAAEALNRRWRSVDPDYDYVSGSIARFPLETCASGRGVAANE